MNGKRDKNSSKMVESRSIEETEPRVEYNESDLLLTKIKQTKAQHRLSQQKSNKRKNQEEPEPEEHRKRKHIVPFSTSPLIHDANSEEKGVEELEQGMWELSYFSNRLTIGSIGCFVISSYRNYE
jgi:hypothetical protein